jgi:hypothetical protein
MKKLLLVAAIFTLAACGNASTEVKTDSTAKDSVAVDSVKLDTLK